MSGLLPDLAACDAAWLAGEVYRDWTTRLGQAGAEGQAGEPEPEHGCRALVVVTASRPDGATHPREEAEHDEEVARREITFVRVFGVQKRHGCCVLLGIGTNRRWSCFVSGRLWLESRKIRAGSG